MKINIINTSALAIASILIEAAISSVPGLSRDVFASENEESIRATLAELSEENRQAVASISAGRRSLLIRMLDTFRSLKIRQNSASDVLFQKGYSDAEGNLYPNAFDGLGTGAKAIFYTVIGRHFYGENKSDQIIKAAQVAGYLDEQQNISKANIDAIPSSERYSVIKILLQTHRRLSDKDNTNIAREFNILKTFFFAEKGIMKPGDIEGVSPEAQISEKAFLVESMLGLMLKALSNGGGVSLINWIQAFATGQGKELILNPIYSAGFCDESCDIRWDVFGKLSPGEQAGFITVVIGILHPVNMDATLNILKSTGYLTKDEKENSALIDSLPEHYSICLRLMLSKVFKMRADSQAQKQAEGRSKESAIAAAKEIFLEDPRWSEEGRLQLFPHMPFEEQAFVLEILPIERFMVFFRVLQPMQQAVLLNCYFSSEQRENVAKHLSEEELQVISMAQKMEMDKTIERR